MEYYWLDWALEATLIIFDMLAYRTGSLLLKVNHAMAQVKLFKPHVDRHFNGNLTGVSWRIASSTNKSNNWPKNILSQPKEWRSCSGLIPSFLYLAQKNVNKTIQRDWDRTKDIIPQCFGAKITYRRHLKWPPLRQSPSASRDVYLPNRRIHPNSKGFRNIRRTTVNIKNKAV